MKINIFEAHDRKEYLIKDQAIVISQGVDDCLKKNPLSLALQSYSPYIYIFAHPRTAEDGVNKRMLYQPRLTKPEPQTNSYLFRALSGSDLLEICWLLPPKELWVQYKKGNVTESETIEWSINQFMYNRKKLEEKHPEDISEERIRSIYLQMKANESSKNLMDKLYNE